MDDKEKIRLLEVAEYRRAHELDAVTIANLEMQVEDLQALLPKPVQHDGDTPPIGTSTI